MRRRLTYLLVMTAIAVTAGAVVQAAGTIAPGHFLFLPFSSPSGTTQFGVQGINDGGVITGYFTSTTGIRGFERQVFGKYTTLLEPQDTSPTTVYTEGIGINNHGTITGEFYGAADNTYSGFFYTNGHYTEYDVPGEPPLTTSAVYGINDYNDFCGFFWPPPYAIINAFISIKGEVTKFVIGTSVQTVCDGINNAGDTGGYYIDTAGVIHGFLRDRDGEITYVDVPGASTTPGEGTVLFGPNDRGDVSGHFWDSSHKEHGFLRTHEGKFYQIDVPFPGAQATGGGGLNNFDVVVGHWTDSSGVQQGYIAVPF